MEIARKKDDEEALQSQVNLKLDLTEISLREEIIWYQRSRKLWLQEGDHNTIYFHSMAFSRKKNNIIHCLFDANNNELRDGYLGAHIMDFYKELFTAGSFVSTPYHLDFVPTNVIKKIDEFSTNTTVFSR